MLCKEILFHLIFFLLCAEGLGALIEQHHTSIMVRGIYVERCFYYYSFIFVDDSIIFTCASVNEATIVTNILCRRDVLSGQKVNVEKCEICLSNKLEPHL